MADKEPAKAKRYALYDETTGQFVGGVVADKADVVKPDQHSDPRGRLKGHKLTTREV